MRIGKPKSDGGRTHPVRHPRAQLRLTELEYRVVPTITGSLDVVAEDSYLMGWAKDSTTSDSISVDVYVDGVDQSRTLASQYRSDLGGYYGFRIPIPQVALGGLSTHHIQVYGVNTTTSASGLLSGGDFNLPPGYTAITGAPDANGQSIQIKTSGRDAGAISSLTWNGLQFINSYDQGRLFQSDYQAITQNQPTWGGGLYNPTEGGSQDDAVPAPRTTSTSQLQAISTPQSNQLTTTTNMAFWLYQGEKNSLGQTAYDIANPPNPSDSILSKNVTIGYNGNNNIIKYDTTFTIPSQGYQHLSAGDQLTQATFAILDAFLQADPQNPSLALTNAWAYDPSKRELLTQPFDFASNTGSSTVSETNRFPKVMATPDGQYAIAIVTDMNSLVSGADGRGFEVGTRYTPQGRNPSVVSSGTILSDSFTVSNFRGQAIGGTYAFSSYIVVGSLSTVVASLRSLQAGGHIAPPNFNGDSTSDMLWNDPQTGADSIWLSKDPAQPGGVKSWAQNQFALSPVPGYQPYFGDFNGDGTQDILWHDPGPNGTNLIWLMQDPALHGGSWANGGNIYITANPGMQPYLGDFDGNGTTDILWHDPSPTGTNAIWLFQMLQNPDDSLDFAANWAKSGYFIGANAETPYVGEFNGDGTADILWHSQTDNSIWLMQDPTASGSGGNWAKAGYWVSPQSYQPHLGDFNGDGITDILWHDPSPAGANVVWLMQSPTWDGTNWVNWARYGFDVSATADTPYLGDFNGDGMTDIFWHGSAGDQWDNVIWLMQDPTLNGGSWAKSAYSMGANADTPYLGDFDGDGVTDILWNVQGQNAIWLLQAPTWNGTIWAGWAKNGYWIDNDPTDPANTYLYVD